MQQPHNVAKELNLIETSQMVLLFDEMHIMYRV